MGLFLPPCLQPSLTTIILKFGFLSKRCPHRSHLFSFISSTRYHFTKFSGWHFKNDSSFSNPGTQHPVRGFAGNQAGGTALSCVTRVLSACPGRGTRTASYLPLRAAKPERRELWTCSGVPGWHQQRVRFWVRAHVGSTDVGQLPESVSISETA